MEASSRPPQETGDIIAGGDAPLIPTAATQRPHNAESADRIIAEQPPTMRTWDTLTRNNKDLAYGTGTQAATLQRCNMYGKSRAKHTTH